MTFRCIRCKKVKRFKFIKYPKYRANCIVKQKYWCRSCWVHEGKPNPIKIV